MLETLLVGLLITAVSGLTFVAYKHPAGYRKISGYLILTAFGIACAIEIWNYAVVLSELVTRQFVSSSNTEAARAALNAIQIPWSIPIALNIGAIYCAFLIFLPRILDLETRC